MARASLWFTMAGVAAISIATPLVSQSNFAKWFSFPNNMQLLPIPAATHLLFGENYRSLQRLPVPLGREPATIWRNSSIVNS